jgi:hypothetical protein
VLDHLRTNPPHFPDGARPPPDKPAALPRRCSTGTGDRTGQMIALGSCFERVIIELD